jgi:hypothetical protein
VKIRWFHSGCDPLILVIAASNRLRIAVSTRHHEEPESRRGHYDIPRIVGIVCRGEEGGVKGLDRFAAA